MIKRKEILCGLLGILGILGIMELYIRGSMIVTPSLTDYTEPIGRVRRNDLNFVMFGEGFTISRFNQGRYLGPFYASEKEANVIRIALLGDSYVEGFQVFDRHHFRSVIEQRLSNSTKNTVEVLNFGRSGFDLEDIVAYNYLFVNEYQADYVLYFLSSDDFLSKVSDKLVPNLSFSSDSIVANMPAKEVQIDNYIKYKDIPYYASYINMMNNCLKQHKRGGTSEKLFGKFYFDRTTSTYIDDSPSNNEIENSLLSRIDTLLEFSSSFSNTIIVKTDTFDFTSDIFEIFIEHDIPIIDLAIPLVEMQRSGYDPNYWSVTNQSGHWNQEAHMRVGEYIAKKLLELADYIE